MGQRWAELAEPADPPAARAEERELLVVGEGGSLFKLLGAARLAGSRARLAALLRGALLREGRGPLDGPPGADADARLAARQASARALVARGRLRVRVEVEARLSARPGRGGSAQQADLEAFARWAERGEPVPRGWGALSALGQLLAAATLAQGALALSLDLVTAWQATLGLQLALYLYTTRRLSAVYLPLTGDLHEPLRGLGRCFELLERGGAGGEEEGLARWRAALLEGGAPSARLRAVAGAAEALAVRHSALLYGLLSIGLLWELRHGVRAWAWRAEHGPRVRRDLALLYDWEALSAVASFAHDHPAYAWPALDLDPRAPLARAEALAHPLFAAATRRANDFTLGAAGEAAGGAEGSRASFVLITGSNMSGKSSFMRALGANATLAFAGAPACARALTLAPLELATCIQVTDDPGQGWSRFYAEVRRIREVIERAEGATAARPVLYLVDEMLSGTNSRERRLASRAIAERLLAAPHAAGIITTHDLDLAALEALHPGRVTCAHFSDVFDGERLTFDYQLKPGVATTTNALQVLWLEGIEVEGGRARREGRGGGGAE